MERRIQLGHSSRVRGPRLVQVWGRVPGVARPEGVQQGWGATAEGHGRPRSRQPEGVPHGQGPARPIGLAPLHPVPVEGRLRADEPRPDGVHDPVHCREQRRGPRSVQGADGREGGLVEESPRTALQVTPCGSVRFLCLRHRVRHQASDGRLLRSAAGPGVPRPIPLSAWHGAAGSAKGGGGWGLGGEHVRQVRNGCGVPQVHVDPQKGSARGARLFVRGGVCPLDAPAQGLLLCAPARACGRIGPGARGYLGAPRAPVGACRRCGGHRVTFSAESAGVWEVGGRRPTVEMAEPEVVPPLSEGVPDLQQAGVDAAPVVLAKRLPLDFLPRVAREDPVVVEGCDEVVPRRAGVPLGGARHVHVAPGEVGRQRIPLAPVRGVSVEEGQQGAVRDCLPPHSQPFAAV